MHSKRLKATLSIHSKGREATLSARIAEKLH